MAQQAFNLPDSNCYDQNAVCMGMCRTYIDDIFNNCDNKVSYLGQASKANSLFNPTCITVYIENARHSLHVLYWNTTANHPIETKLHCLFSKKTVIGQ